MAPAKFLPGDLVLVYFPHEGYWPAEIIKILKENKRKVKYFGEGERGEAYPSGMIYFNDAAVENHLSNSSWKKDPARKKALKKILAKYKKQGLHKNSDESNQKNGGGTKAKDTKVGKDQAAKHEHKQLLKNFKDTKRNLDVETRKRIKLENAMEKIKSDNKILKADNKILKADNKILKADNKILKGDYEEKLQRCSAVYEKKIADLEVKVGEELAAVAGANREIEEYKTKLENMTARVASVEALNESLEQTIENHTNDLENLTIKHKAEILKKVNESKLLNDKIGKLEKDVLAVKKIALEKERGTHVACAEKTINKRFTRKRLEVLNENSIEPGVDETSSGEDKNKRRRMRLEEGESTVWTEVDQSYSEEAKNKRKRRRLEDGESTVRPEVDQSYSEEGKNKRKRRRLGEGESSLEVGESHSGETKNDSKGLQMGESCVNKNLRVVTRLEGGITPIMDLPAIPKKQSDGEATCWLKTRNRKTKVESTSDATSLEKKESKRVKDGTEGGVNKYGSTPEKSIIPINEATPSKTLENNVDDDLEEIEEIPRCDADENSRNGLKITVPFLSITITR